MQVSPGSFIYVVGNDVFVTLPVETERMTVDVIGMDGCPIDESVRISLRRNFEGSIEFSFEFIF